jgi:hypothetical protein
MRVSVCLTYASSSARPQQAVRYEASCPRCHSQVASQELCVCVCVCEGDARQTARGCTWKLGWLGSFSPPEPQPRLRPTRVGLLTSPAPNTMSAPSVCAHLGIDRQYAECCTRITEPHPVICPWQALLGVELEAPCRLQPSYALPACGL